MLQAGQRTVSAQDIARVVCRHWGKSALFLFAVVTIAVLAVLAKPRVFVSEAKLFVRLGRESVGLDPTATTGQTISLNYSRENEIASVQNLLNSRTMFEKVVDDLGTDLILTDGVAPAAWEGWLDQGFGLLGGGQASDEVRRENAIAKLAKGLVIENPRKSHIFEVSYKARSAETAQRVVAAYLQVCRDEYVKVHDNPGSYEFFVKQTEQLQKEVQEANERLRDLKNRVGLASVEGQRKVLEDHLSRLDVELLTARSELAASQELVARLAKELPEGEDVTKGATGLSTRALDDMRNQLYGLQLQERQLLAQHSANHPKVTAIREQVKQAESLLATQQWMVESSNVATLSSKIASFEHQREAAFHNLQKMNEDEVQLNALERHSQQLTENYLLYMKNKEQARIDQELDSQRITNLSIAESPTLPGKPLSRKGLFVVALALCVGLFGGIGLAFVLESLDDSIRTPQDVEASLGVPVLLSVPRSSAAAIFWKSARGTA